MGRSNKEERLTHSGMSIETGHGGMKRNRYGNMGAGQSIRPQGETEGSGLTRAKAAAKARSGQAGGAGAPPAPQTVDDMGEAGWDAIGKAGASIADTYVTRRKAKKAGSE